MSVSAQNTPRVGNRVRLKTDVAPLGLQCGDTGLVCSTWFSPVTVFEVEFQQLGMSYPVRALLWAGQIEADEQLQAEADAQSLHT
jgi:hypothetical protein